MYRSEVNKRSGLGCTIVSIVGLVAMFGFILLMGRLQEIGRENARNDAIAAFGDEIISLCSNLGAVSEGTINISGIPKVLLLETGSDYVHGLHANLDSQHQATNKDDLDAILCIEETEVSVGSCSYTGGRNYSLIQKVLNVTIVDPDTGEAVGSGSLKGGDPGDCPNTITDNTSSSMFEGSSVRASQMESWIDQNVR